jgi:hypothetical protein
VDGRGGSGESEGERVRVRCGCGVHVKICLRHHRRSRQMSSRYLWLNRRGREKERESVLRMACIGPCMLGNDRQRMNP